MTLNIRLKSGCPNEFSLKSGGGEVTLRPDEEHSVVVRFSPTESESYKCYLDLGECGEIKLVGAGPDDDMPVPPQPKRSSGM
jgi:hypothetical protein